MDEKNAHRKETSRLIGVSKSHRSSSAKKALDSFRREGQVDPLPDVLHQSSPHPVVFPENRVTNSFHSSFRLSLPLTGFPARLYQYPAFPSLPLPGAGRHASNLRLGNRHPEPCRGPVSQSPFWAHQRAFRCSGKLAGRLVSILEDRIKIAHGLHAYRELENFDGRIKVGVSSNACQGIRNTGIFFCVP